MDDLNKTIDIWNKLNFAKDMIDDEACKNEAKDIEEFMKLLKTVLESDMSCIDIMDQVNLFYEMNQFKNKLKTILLKMYVQQLKNKGS